MALSPADAFYIIIHEDEDFCLGWEVFLLGMHVTIHHKRLYQRFSKNEGKLQLAGIHTGGRNPPPPPNQTCFRDSCSASSLDCHF